MKQKFFSFLNKTKQKTQRTIKKKGKDKKKTKQK